MNEAKGCNLSPKEVTTEQADVERSMTIMRAAIILGPSTSWADLPARGIRAVACAAKGIDVREKSEGYIHGAFDALVETHTLAPAPKHDPILLPRLPRP